MVALQDKQALRAHYKALRAGLGVARCAQGSARIVELVAATQEFERARSVALFWPILERGEVDLRALDEWARQLGKDVYYPWMTEGPPFQCGFRLVQEPEGMRPTRYGAKEPVTGAEAQAGALELVLVPALAVMRDGHRLGYGAGCYDRLLARFCPPGHSIAVAFEEQLALALPVAPHDQRCSAVILGGK